MCLQKCQIRQQVCMAVADSGDESLSNRGGLNSGASDKDELRSADSDSDSPNAPSDDSGDIAKASGTDNAHSSTQQDISQAQADNGQKAGNRDAHEQPSGQESTSKGTTEPSAKSRDESANAKSKNDMEATSDGDKSSGKVGGAQDQPSKATAELSDKKTTSKRRAAKKDSPRADKSSDKDTPPEAAPISGDSTKRQVTTAQPDQNAVASDAAASAIVQSRDQDASPQTADASEQGKAMPSGAKAGADNEGAAKPHAAAQSPTEEGNSAESAKLQNLLSAPTQLLDSLMKDAINDEDYGLAAKLRDEIKRRNRDGREMVREANRMFYAAFEDCDFRGMAAIWGDGDHVQCIHPQAGCIAGRADVLASWHAVLGGVGSFSIRLENVRITLLGEASAYVTCTEIVSARDNKGRTAATNIFEKQQGRWQIVHHHGSPEPAPLPRASPPPKAPPIRT